MFRKLLCVFLFLLVGQLSHAVYEWQNWNHYQILSVPENATQQEIETAYEQHKKDYKSQARNLHPDQNKGNEQEATERMKEVNALQTAQKKAYEVLSDSHKRADYDEELSQKRSNVQNQESVYGTQESVYGTQEAQSAYRNNWKGVFDFDITQSQTVSLTKPERQAIRSFLKLSFFQQSADEFLETEQRHRDLLNKKRESSLSSSEQKELHEIEKNRRRDLRIFGKAMEALGLPRGSQPSVLVQAWFEGAKQEWMQKSLNRSVKALDFLAEQRGSFETQTLTLENRSDLEKVKTAVNESKQQLNLMTYENLKNQIDPRITAIRTATQDIDQRTYEMLRQQANPINFQTIKSFPVQFAMFAFAMGASIYAHSFSQENLSLGTTKSPGELSSTMNHLLTPYGIFNFYVFVTISQQMHYRLYGWGKKLDGKSLKSYTFTGKTLRALSPGVGLGSGFFVSNLLTELWQDESLRACVKEKSFKKQNTDSENSRSEDQKSSFESVVQDHINSCEQFVLNWKANEKWKIYAVDIASLIGSSVISHKIINSAILFIQAFERSNRMAKFLTGKIGSKFLGHIGFAVHFMLFLEVHIFLEYWLGKTLKKQFVSGGVDKSLKDLESRLSRIFKLNPPQDMVNSKNKDLWIEKPSSFTLNPSDYYLEDQTTRDNLQQVTESFRIARDNLQQVTESFRIARDNLQQGVPFLQLKERIKETGYRFQHWTILANQDYNHSYHLWVQSTDIKRVNYDLSLNLLKEILKDTPSDNLLENFGRKIDREKYPSATYLFTNPEDTQFYKEEYCESTKQIFENPEDEEIEKPVWKKLCDDDIFHVSAENERQSIYDTARLINLYLQQIKSSIEQNNNRHSEELTSQDHLSFQKMYGDLSAQDYISFHPHELFSSDPQFSVENLKYEQTETAFKSINYQKWFVLSSNLIQAGLDINNSLSVLSSDLIDQLKKQKLNEYGFEDQAFFWENPLNHQADIEEFSDNVYWICIDYYKDSEYDSQEVKNYCDNKFQEAKNFLNAGGFLNEIKKEISFKYMLAGFYLLRKISQEKHLHERLGKNIGLRTSIVSVLDKISPLLALVEIYKKGEKLFLDYTSSSQMTKNFTEIMNSPIIGNLLKDNTAGNLSYVVQALLCNNHEYSSDKFNVPHFFKNESQEIQVYNFESDKYQKLEEHCQISNGLWRDTRAMHSFLFETSTQYQGDRYENLYLVLHQILSVKYTGVRTLELEQVYEELSQEEITKVQESIFEDLDILQNHYYNKMLAFDSPVSVDSSLEDFLNYYTQDNVGWNWCEIADAATFNSLRCDQHESFKEIEMTIFQVNYWLETLKAFLENGKQGNYRSTDKKAANKHKRCRSLTLNQKGLSRGNQAPECGDVQIKFDIQTFEAMQKQILSCLQAQHDFFKTDSDLSKEDIREYCFMETKIENGVIKPFGTEAFKNKIEKQLLPSIQDRPFIEILKASLNDYCLTKEWPTEDLKNKFNELNNEDKQSFERYCSIKTETEERFSFLKIPSEQIALKKYCDNGFLIESDLREEFEKLESGKNKKNLKRYCSTDLSDNEKNKIANKISFAGTFLNPSDLETYCAIDQVGARFENLELEDKENLKKYCSKEVSIDDLRSYCFSREDKKWPTENELHLRSSQFNNEDRANFENYCSVLNEEVMTSADYNIKSILSGSIPTYNFSNFIKNLKDNNQLNPTTNYEDIFYSMWSALYKSLENFYGSIAPLKLQQDTQKLYSDKEEKE